jgi:hypothetical protein
MVNLVDDWRSRMAHLVPDKVTRHPLPVAHKVASCLRLWPSLPLFVPWHNRQAKPPASPYATLVFPPHEF